MGAHQGRADRSDPTGAWQDAGVSSLWCFQCGAEYEPGVETCVECGVGLVTQAPLAPEDAIALGEPETEDVIHFDDDLQVNDLLSNAFDAADRIKGNTHDHEAILEFLESEAVIDRVALPYGFERESWDRVRLVLGTLRD